MILGMSRGNFVRLAQENSLEKSFFSLQKESPLPIASQNWGAGKILPAVSFFAGWNESGIFLCYQVKEKESLRRFSGLNDPVWKDSCVEFFIQPDSAEPFYCNFEFNSLGGFLSQQGKNREDRIFITPQEAQTVFRSAFYESKSEVVNGICTFEANWTLRVFLPKALLEARKIQLEAGRVYRCNFYKCGDELQDVHFLSWNRVETPSPDFHTPAFFGEMQLA